MLGGYPLDVTHDQVFPPIKEKPKRIKQILIAGVPYQINKVDTIIPKGFNKIHERAVYLLAELLRVYGWDIQQPRHIGIMGLLDRAGQGWRYDHDYDLFATKTTEEGLKIYLVIEVDGWNTSHPSEDQKLTPAVREKHIKQQKENDDTAMIMLQFYFKYILPKSQVKNDKGMEIIFIRPEKEQVVSFETDEELISYLESRAIYVTLDINRVKCRNLNIRAKKARYFKVF